MQAMLKLMLIFMLFLFSSIFAQLDIKNASDKVLFRITEEGHVGVGTLAPEAKMVVKDNNVDSVTILSPVIDQTKMGFRINVNQKGENKPMPIGLQVVNDATREYLGNSPAGIKSWGSLPDIGSNMNQENLLYYDDIVIMSSVVNRASRQTNYNIAEGLHSTLVTNQLVDKGYHHQRAVVGNILYNDHAYTKTDVGKGVLGYSQITPAQDELDQVYGLRGSVEDPNLLVGGSSRSAAVYGQVETIGPWFQPYPPFTWAGYFTGSKSYFNHAIGIHTEHPTTGFAVDVIGKFRCESLVGFADLRLTTNVEAITGALGIVGNLRGVRYKWNMQDYSDWFETPTTQLGLIAQEVETVLPEVVHTGDRGFKSVSYDKLVAVLIQAVKELNDKISELEQRVN